MKYMMGMEMDMKMIEMMSIWIRMNCQRLRESLQYRGVFSLSL